jgi:hypothetical protein
MPLGAPGIAGTPGGEIKPPGGIIVFGMVMPGGPLSGMPAGFCCTMCIGMLLFIIAMAAHWLSGGADEYGAAIGIFVPYGPSTPGTVGGP